MRATLAKIGSRNATLIWYLGVLGIIFYAVGPVLFPDADLRQPELLPLYTLMIGLGELMRSREDSNEDFDG